MFLKKKDTTLRKVSHWQFECIGDRIKCHILVFDSPKKKKKSWKDTKCFIILLDETFYIHKIDFNIHHIYVKHLDRRKCDYDNNICLVYNLINFLDETISKQCMET